MKKRAFCKCVAFYLTAFFLMVPDICVGWDDGMEMLRDVDFSTRRHEWYPSVEYNSIDNEFLVLWNTSGKLPEDCPGWPDSRGCAPAPGR